VLGHLLKECAVGVESPGLASRNCTGPAWERIPNQSSAGASPYRTLTSIKACLDYCAQSTGCVAVDVQVNVFPPGCWPHFNASYLVKSNTYYLTGTVQYRLKTRCSTVATGAYQSARITYRLHNNVCRSVQTHCLLSEIDVTCYAIGSFWHLILTYGFES